MFLQRLNLDSSWLFGYNGSRFVLDPWLVGSEVDGYRWFSEQWHIQEPMPIAELPDFQFMVISQVFEDHCHLPTLQQFDSKYPLLATPNAYRRLQKAFPERDLLEIPTDGTWLSYGGWRFTALRPAFWQIPPFFALLIQAPEGKTIFYAPHGFSLRTRQLDQMMALRIDLLMTTFTEFRLPFWLGGAVNPGRRHAEKLYIQLRPTQVINTHDEPKRMAGLVARLARTRYPDLQQIQAERLVPLIQLPDYRVVEL